MAESRRWRVLAGIPTRRAGTRGGVSQISAEQNHEAIKKALGIST